ncbi:MAG: hypothetical protein AAFP86_10300 [Planctomycetota bacterium]
MHLDLAHNSSSRVALPGGNVTAATTGPALELANFRATLFLLAITTAGGDITVDFEESDTAGGAYTPVPDAQTVLTGALDGTVKKFQLDNSPRRRFVRAVVTPAAASQISMTATLYRPDDTRYGLTTEDEPEIFLIQ